MSGETQVRVWIVPPQAAHSPLPVLARVVVTAPELIILGMKITRHIQATCDLCYKGFIIQQIVTNIVQRQI